MQEPDSINDSPECVPGRLVVTFKSIMLPKSREELLKSLGAVVLEHSEGGETVIVGVPEESGQRVLDVLRGAPGVASAARIMRARPAREQGSED